MKLRVEIDDEDYLLDLVLNGEDSEYNVHGVEHASGSASVIEVVPGVFSILLGHRSFQVHVERNGEDWEIWTRGVRHRAQVADARNRSGKGKKIAAAGPMEIRAQMPGKLIKLLVKAGETVQAGQGLVVVEAMKMQNEMKSPKDGTVSKIKAIEGSTVLAGEALLVVE